MAAKSIKPGDSVYVVRAFDTYQWKFYIPSPGVFLTQREVDTFCDENSNGGVVMTWSKITVGRMKRLRVADKKRG